MLHFYVFIAFYPLSIFTAFSQYGNLVYMFTLCPSPFSLNNLLILIWFCRIIAQYVNIICML